MGREEGGVKRPPTSYLPVTFTKVEIFPKNFLIFSFNTFLTLVLNFKAIPIAIIKPRLLLKKISFSGQILIKMRL